MSTTRGPGQAWWESHLNAINCEGITVKAYARREGIDETRITHEGKGLSEPKFSPEDEQRLGAWINRRIEIDLIDTGAAE